MSQNVSSNVGNAVSGLIGGLLAIVFWFGFSIYFGSPVAMSFIGAPVVFGVAFGIAMVIGKIASAKKSA